MNPATPPSKSLLSQHYLDTRLALIDRVVYRLYGLTEEEIAIVEA